MLAPSGLARYAFRYDNYGANPSATPGTSVVPGASDAEGSWTQLASSANIAQEIAAFSVRVSNGSTSGQPKPHLLDIGIDPAGGTSYGAILSNIVCGASLAAPGGHRFLFPLRIPAGASVAARVQGTHATAGTIRIGASFWGQPSRPEAVSVGSFAETIGTITGSSGVTFTPGNAADGTWVSLGTTTQSLWWWQLAYQVNNGAITAEYCYVDLAVGDVTNKRVIHRAMNAGATAETCGDVLGCNLNAWAAYCPVPAGAELWVRGRSNNAPDTGFSAVAIGIGG